MAVIRVQQYDHGIKLYFTIKKDRVIEPILGATVHFKMQLRDGSRVLNRICEITDAELGECLYTLTTQDTGVVGDYITEVQVNYGNGTILSQDNPVFITITKEVISRKDKDDFEGIPLEFNNKLLVMERNYKSALAYEKQRYEKMKNELEDEILNLMEELESNSLS